MKKSLSVILCVLLSLCVIAGSCVSAGAFSFFRIGDGFSKTVNYSQKLAPGITEEHIVTYKKGETGRNDNYVATIDFSKGNVGMIAGYANYDSSGKWSLQTLTKQVKAAEAATGKNIVVAVNGDFFKSTGEPVNTLIMHGETVKKSTANYYFAILKDGTPVIRKATESTDDVVEAVGTNNLLLKDGEIKVTNSNPELAPRTAIGITADGSVKVLVTDGRNSPTSVGYTLYETAQMMKSLGCVDALNLDGGGSSTFCTKSSGTMEVKNNPSDGQQRAVSSTLLFYSDSGSDEAGSVFSAIIRIIKRIIEFIISLIPTDVTGALFTNI